MPPLISYGSLLRALTLSGSVIVATPSLAASLTVAIDGLRSDSGVVRIGLYDSPTKFPESGGERQEIVVPASRDHTVAVFEDLSPGPYALALYHDENANGDFDSGILGLPLEGYGFSRDAAVFLGPPPFEAARLFVPVEGLSVRITMHYMLDDEPE